MPKVSIVIPVYNAERFIVETLSSVVEQTFTDWEALVVDDGSTDGSLALLKAFDDPRIKVITGANQGAALARNKGIERAKGDFIALLDADDIWTPDKLAKQVKQLESRSEVGISFCQSEFIDMAGLPMGRYQRPKLTDITARDVMCRNPLGNGSVPMARRSVFDDVAFQLDLTGTQTTIYFDPRSTGWEDVEFWTRVAFKTSWQFEGLAERLNFYRVVHGSLSGSFQKHDKAVANGLQIVAAYAPNLVARHGAATVAFNKRFLAQRLIEARDGRQALSYAWQAISKYPKILVESPLRTISVLLAALALVLLPTFLINRLFGVFLQQK